MYKFVLPGFGLCINLFYLDWFVYTVIPGLVGVKQMFYTQTNSV